MSDSGCVVLLNQAFCVVKTHGFGQLANRSMEDPRPAGLFVCVGLHFISLNVLRSGVVAVGDSPQSVCVCLAFIFYRGGGKGTEL